MDKKEKLFIRIPAFTPIVRVFHWARAFCVVFLVFSGFYLAYPFIAPNVNGEPTGFLYALFRSAHVIAGFLLIAVSIARFYTFLAASKNDNERVSMADLVSAKVWIAQIKCYLFLGPHPHIRGVYNPLQFTSYFILSVLVLIISVTGVILYGNVYHNGLGGALAGICKWLEVALGGLANVRQIHHITTWCIMIFIPVHLYMVVWNSVKNPDGGADSIAGGYRYQEVKA